jgi:hypothetical protein
LLFVSSQTYPYQFFLCELHQLAKFLFLRSQKKLGRGGEDRPPGIILRRDRNMVPAKKIPEPSPPPPPTLAGRHRPLCNGPTGGWRAGRNPGAGGAQRRDFFNQARNSPPRGIKLRTWRCYSEALTITLEALSPFLTFTIDDSGVMGFLLVIPKWAPSTTHNSFLQL